VQTAEAYFHLKDSTWLGCLQPKVSPQVLQLLVQEPWMKLEGNILGEKVENYSRSIVYLSEVFC
jgi:hypothetical protein